MHPLNRDEESWTVATAKAKFSEVIDRAQSTPQTITRNGKPAVIVVSVEEWHNKTVRQGSLAAFLMNSPLRDADLNLDRQGDEPTGLLL